MNYKKKLIEVALPLEAINAESSREKSIRHGHPSTLHLWWSRKPTATARAVIFSSLVDDPSSLPEQFPTEKEQEIERKRLFDLLEQLVKWENSNNEKILDQAKAEIMKSTGGNPPALLDPFAGGGTIPLEAQRLGLEAHASDLNPVAVMINKAMIEIPPKFANQPPVNPDARVSSMKEGWKGAAGLAEDARYYGEWMKKEAFKRIGHLYPKVKIPIEQGGGEATVIAWIWTRTVKCPNPACGCEMPLTSKFLMAKKAGKQAYVQPIIEGKEIRYVVKTDNRKPPDGSIINRQGARCIFCGNVVKFDYIREEASKKQMNARLMAIVAEGQRGRRYFSPSDEHIRAADIPTPDNCPETEIPHKALGINIRAYGFEKHKDLFTNRQLTALTTFSDLVKEAQEKAEQDALRFGLRDDRLPLAEGGLGARAYGQAVGVYLAFAVDKAANLWSSLCSWMNDRGALRETFARQAISMVWDYAEANPFSNVGGSFSMFIDRCSDAIRHLPNNKSKSLSYQLDAQSDNGFRNILISTDPPYYDNIGYSDLSDFFYIWMRQSLKQSFPNLFQTMLVPKAEELVASSFRFDGVREKARIFFEEGMLSAVKQIYICSTANYPVSIYYAFKQSDSEIDGDFSTSVSTGWETMLSAIINAEFIVTGTWPVRTESTGRIRALDSNALASSIVLVCRKRLKDAPVCTRRDFINMLKRELKPALMKLQASNIAPVDLAQSAIGPGMGVYSRYSKVLEADGSSLSVRSALGIINQELDLYFTEQEGELDSDSRFCVDLFSQYAFNEIRFGEADVLARAKNTSVERLVNCKVLSAQKGYVRLLTREELPVDVRNKDPIVWLLTQQLTRAMELGGEEACAKIISESHGVNVEHAKALAYRLYTVAERKGWASEAFVYNSLVIGWADVQNRTAELSARGKNAEQINYFDFGNKR